VGDRKATLLSAWSMLAPQCRAGRMSRIYESLPLYVLDQPPFLNAVGVAWSRLPPLQMLGALQEIERTLGRDRSRERRMGPRTLDLDILLCGDLVLETPVLSIPHPRLEERAFVLVPLLELDPGTKDPRSGSLYSRALDQIDAREGGPAGRGVYLYTGG